MKISLKVKKALVFSVACIVIIVALFFAYKMITKDAAMPDKRIIRPEPFTDETEAKFVYDMSKCIIEIARKIGCLPRNNIPLQWNAANCKIDFIHIGYYTYIFRLVCKKTLFFKYVANAAKSPNELQITKAVKHPNIVEALYAFPTDDEKGYFIVTEGMDCNLKEYAKNHQNELKNMVRSVALALQYLHKNNIIHCAVKLSNILVKTVNGKAVFKLSSFDAAQFITTDEIINYKTPKSSGYEAPETCSERRYSLFTDIWQLGHTIWFYIKSESIFYREKGNFDIYKYGQYLAGDRDNLLAGEKLRIVRKCCKIEPKQRASLKYILEWCDQSRPANTE